MSDVSGFVTAAIVAGNILSLFSCAVFNLKIIEPAVYYGCRQANNALKPECIEREQKGTKMRTYVTIQDYIDQNIAPGLGDVEFTYEQAQEVAHRMTEWNESGQLVERQGVAFWNVVSDVLGDT